MSLFWVIYFCFLAAAFGDGPWAVARPGVPMGFPRAHFAHPDYKTEWWYVTGTLTADDGARFGYQFTIFRRGVRTPAQRAEPVTSQLVVNDLMLGHFTLTDEKAGTFVSTQRIDRGSFGRAGWGREGEPRLAWVEDAAITWSEADGFKITAQPGPEAALSLHLRPTRAPILHGEQGLSQKSAGEGAASHYYSLTRLETSGTITQGGRARPVRGLSWLDREWATNQLGAGQVGWDWFSLHLSDGGELMLYQLRRADGTADPWSSGTYVAPDGQTRALRATDFTLTPTGATWTSPQTGGRYPVRWSIRIPALDLALETTPWLDAQELVHAPISYWEGAVDARGTRAGAAITAIGYLELTGYTGPLAALHGGD
jgi:predicted secreted hydrolase